MTSDKFFFTLFYLEFVLIIFKIFLSLPEQEITRTRNYPNKKLPEQEITRTRKSLLGISNPVFSGKMFQLFF